MIGDCAISLRGFRSATFAEIARSALVSDGVARDDVTGNTIQGRSIVQEMANGPSIEELQASPAHVAQFPRRFDPLMFWVLGGEFHACC
jgi:hypothetical protein